MPRVRLCLIAAALVAASAAPAPAPAAAPLRIHDAGPSGPLLFAATRGVVVSPVAPGDVQAVALATGGHTPVPAPGICQLTGVAGASALWDCPGPSALADGQVTDLRTGQAFPLASPAAYLGRPGEQDFDYATYTAIGAHWLRLTISGYHWQRDRYVDRATGVARDPDPSDRRTTADVDLDDPALVHPLCGAIRRPLVESPAFPLSLVAGPIVRDGATAVALTRRGLRLMRCGRPARILDRCTPSRCVAPVVDGRVVAWAVADVVKVYDRRTGRIRTRALGGAITALVSGGADGALAAAVAGADGPASGPYRLVAITAR